VEAIEADYLIVGSGAVGMAFCDVLLAETDATLVVIDRHHAPGGHWNDAYPFVRLHQPSAYYGVCSRALGSNAIETRGLNAGMLERASAAELLYYYDALMQSYVASGRLRYFPMCNYLGEGQFARAFSDDKLFVKVRKKTVDTTYLNTAVPSTHPPKYSVAEGVRCIAPNELVRLPLGPSHFTVVGAGKTGIDACLWLLENGVNPDDICWIMPRDSWFQNRVNVQTGEAFFEKAFTSFALQIESVAGARSLKELFSVLEAEHQLLRLDSKVEPQMYHGATMSLAELAALRSIHNVVRLGRVQQIRSNEMILEGGTLATVPGTVYVDCSASAVARRPLIPVFSGAIITPQFVKAVQPVFSAALIAYVETSSRTEAEKNKLCEPIIIPDAPVDWLVMLLEGLRNQSRWSKDEDLKTWMAGTRLDPFSGMARGVKEKDVEKLQLLKRYAGKVGAALENAKRLLAFP
jgi:NAD(P)-binding Rossmann-like domain